MRFFFSCLVAALVAACGSDPISVESRSSSVEYNPSTGKTTVISQIIVRDHEGFPIPEEDVKIKLYVNDSSLDSESLLQKDSEALSVNVNFSMVLDSSYSMLQQSPPAFEPMKNAAENSIKSLSEFWSDRGQKGQVSWDFLWFEERLNWPMATWTPEDIRQLPEPAPGSSTKLFSATHAMVKHMTEKFQAGVASGERDLHVLVVFTDGADNYSWFDNSSDAEDQLTIPGKNLRYSRKGYPSTSPEDVKAAIAAHPRLIVHTIGLGSAINESELRGIAEAGHGQYVQGSSSSAIDDLFERVLQEATTIQTIGAHVPLRPNDYMFKVEVEVDGAKATHEFSFHAGDAQARVLGAAPAP